MALQLHVIADAAEDREDADPDPGVLHVLDSVGFGFLGLKMDVAHLDDGPFFEADLPRRPDERDWRRTLDVARIAHGSVDAQGGAIRLGKLDLVIGPERPDQARPLALSLAPLPSDRL